jgi:lipoyl(octanoyl) transferase
MQGVWVKRRKICSIGLSFLRWTSRHGFTINLNTPEGRVEGIAGCGLEQATTTSLSVLGYNVSNEAMVSSLLTTMEESLQRSPVDNAL